ncbi:MAG: hypothetical protein QUS14_15785, partial [Pyrinomonadaceae bacterium]|nr:hypothetical protein [Pyrinomonadaceae bacterium]
MVLKISHRSYFWLRILAVVVVIIGIIQLVRVNTPAPEKPVAEAPAVKYTSGPVVEGRVEVPAGEFTSFDIRLNKRSTLKGRFATENLKGSVACLLLTAENFELFRSGKEFQAVSKTGTIPGGNMNTRLEPGNYALAV